MKLSIERAALLRSLGHVQNVVERRTTIPILSNVKLAADDGRLGPDGNRHGPVAGGAGAGRGRPRRARRPSPPTRSSTSSASCRTGAQSRSSRTARRREITVRAGRSVFNLPTLPADEFPAIGEEQLGVRFAMPAADLAKLIDKTRFAISTEETRYYLNGIHVHATKGGAAAMLRGVATDGHRLARVEVALPKGAEQIPPIIVPRKTVGEIRKLLEGETGEVEVSVSPTRIQFSLSRSVLVSRLIDGTFPEYERVIPAGNEKIAALEAKEFERRGRPRADDLDRQGPRGEAELRPGQGDGQRGERRRGARSRGNRRRISAATPSRSASTLAIYLT